MAVKCVRIGNILHYKTPLNISIVNWVRFKGTKDCIIDSQTAHKNSMKVFAGIEPQASRKEINEALEMYSNGVLLSSVIDAPLVYSIDYRAVTG